LQVYEHLELLQIACDAFMFGVEQPMPQPPQLLMSELRSLHVPPHFVWPAGQPPCAASTVNVPVKLCAEVDNTYVVAPSGAVVSMFTTTLALVGEFTLRD
jgi:hypothetical protein